MRKLFSLLLALTATATLAFAASQSSYQDVNCGSSATLTATPKTGYHFVEWQKDGVQVSTSNPYQVTDVNAVASYKAIFALDTYIVTYNKGTAASANGSDQTDTKTYGVTLNLRSSALFTRTGYTQTAWSESPDGSTNDHAFGWGYTANAAATFYPYWTANTYTITYNKGTAVGATGGNQTDTKTHDVALTLKGAIFTRDGYDQDGWSTNEAGSTKDYNLNASYTTEGNATLYPHWVLKTYTISYNPGANGSGSVASTSKTHGTNATLSSSTFTRAGYTQDGWSTSDGGALAYALGATNYATEGNATLYPHWSINHYTITYHAGANGTGTVASTDKTHGVNTNVSSSTFTRECYTQTGWSYSDGGAEAFGLGAAYTVDADADLYPVWVQDTYTVTFNNHNGTQLKSGSVACGANPTPPASDPVHDAVSGHSYTFTGWNDGTTTYAKGATLPAVSGNVTYTAVFSDATLSYTLSVAVASGQSSMGSVKVDAGPATSVTDQYGETHTITATANACYEFVQWNDGNTNATRSIEITGDITYTATFQIIQYRITAVSDDDSQGTVTVTLP
ncbi:MAG: InlB B-repeat-containing protein [Paludibacteraceae bacterium]|nr:InlB B-repeat-containing protein [Paludibacteraceae bacterium]